MWSEGQRGHARRLRVQNAAKDLRQVLCNPAVPQVKPVFLNCLKYVVGRDGLPTKANEEAIKDTTTPVDCRLCETVLGQPEQLDRICINFG